MKKALALLVFLPLVTGYLKPDLAETIAETPENISVIIWFHAKPTIGDISTIRADGARIKYQYTIINAVAAKVPAQVVEKIGKRPFVKLIEPDYEVKLVLDQSISQIQVDKVWEEGITGKDIDVAILDTGIHDEHPYLTVEKEVDYTGEGTDDLHGHGTHCAGIVASTDLTYRGVAYDSDLFNVKVLNKDGIGYSSDVIKGIEWAIANGAEIISMSLGARVEPCDGTDALSQAVDQAVNRGIVVVVAAGNYGPDSGTITSPGCSKKAITVGAVDDNDRVPDWSSRGPTADGRVKPDLVAPGVTITSTWKDNSFRSLSGTSMSTPHVSGVAALLLEADSTLEPDEVKEALKTTALDLGLDENTQGAGRVDAYEAYKFISVTLPPAGITPDSWMYRFKRVYEWMDLFFTFDDLKRAEKHLKYAELRLAETKEMIEKGKPEFVDQLVEEYEADLERANLISRLAYRNVTELTELIAVSTSIHTDLLEELLEKTPVQARPAIQRAIISSKRGNMKALEVLEEIRPERAAEIHFMVAEKRLAKAKEKADRGEIEEAADLVREYEKRINESSKIIETAKSLGKDTTEVEQLIIEKTPTHVETLLEVHQMVPEEEKQTIEKAINTSTKGREKAVESLKEKELKEAEIPGPEKTKKRF